jgi:peptide-methionine (S)-S-oxide reductase
MTLTKGNILDMFNGNMTRLETATFGAGCFWGVEETFRQLPGVKSTAVGYLGGTLENPTYEDVCTGRTGHAEVVQLTYDPDEVTYEKLLDVFWTSHNPTTKNRQGWDIGTQYRSAIFFHTPKQESIARQSKAAQQPHGLFRKEVVTEITPASVFYPAEEYHQQYLSKRGAAACHI